MIPLRHRQGRGIDKRLIDVMGIDPFRSDLLATGGLDDRQSSSGHLQRAGADGRRDRRDRAKLDTGISDSNRFETCRARASKAFASSSSSRTDSEPLTTVLPALPVRQKLWGWLLDYVYAAYWMTRAIAGRSSPEAWLHPATTQPGSPVLLIPGVFESWRFLQPVAEHLHRQGHPVHVLDELGFNTGAIPELAALASDYLERTDLHDVTVIGHSKGGLIAKQALGQSGTLQRVRHVIAVNTPFSGSRYASLVPLASVRMFRPTGPVIRALILDTAVNRRITSLYSVFDPHIPESSRLNGAENIPLTTIGHFRPLAAADTLQLITSILERPTQLTADDQELA